MNDRDTITADQVEALESLPPLELWKLQNDGKVYATDLHGDRYIIHGDGSVSCPREF
jgi:hypothetical protein